MRSVTRSRIFRLPMLLSLACIVFAVPRVQGAVSLPTSQGPYQAEIADLDGDGHPDLLVPCRGDLLAPEEKRPGNDVMTVYLTSGKRLPNVRRHFGVGFGPYTAAVGDLDGDRIPDAVVANFQANDGRHLSILSGSKDRPAIFAKDRPITIGGTLPLREELLPRWTPDVPDTGPHLGRHRRPQR